MIHRIRLSKVMGEYSDFKENASRLRGKSREKERGKEREKDADFELERDCPLMR